MPLFGSDGGFQADNRGGVIDGLGNTIVSASTDFGASPLGVAARTQALYGIPNATFNLLPPDPSSPIVPNQNDLPYWDIDDLSAGAMTATTVFDAATQTWGVELNPGTAVSGAVFTLSTRSYLITDDNLALRQKALAVLSKSGTAAVSTEWNLTLSAIYYDGTDTALSTAFIGTALDTGSWTSMSGTTTPGGSAINAAAQYVDLTFTLTATAAVTGSAKATIKSLLLATSTPAAGGGGFLVTEVFTSNGTWTRPTGVDFVTVMGIGGGGGAASGTGIISFNVPNQFGGGGAGGARFGIVSNVPVTAGSYSIGIGDGGAGGIGGTASKASGAGTANVALSAVTGSDGGATTFGSLITFPGGNKTASGTAGASAAAQVTTAVYGTDFDASGVGAGGGQISAGAPATVGTAGAGITNTYLKYYATAGVAGTAGAIGSTTGLAGTAVIGSAGVAGSAGWVGGGGAASAATGNAAGTAGAGGGGAGSGGGNALRRHTASTTMSATGGNGGNAAPNTGAAGGAGGMAITTVTDSTAYNTSTLTIVGGNGGAGGSGLLVVSYVA
jgi:hypothetical protein